MVDTILKIKFKKKINDLRAPLKVKAKIKLYWKRVRIMKGDLVLHEMLK